MDVIKKINELKKEHGWSDYTLASKAGLSSSTIANLNRRKTVPSIETLEQICGAFGITLSQFFYEDDQKVMLNEEQLDVIKEWNLLTVNQKEMLYGLMQELNNNNSKRKQKQAEGIAAAKEKGVRFGREKDPLPDNFYDVVDRYRSKELTAVEAAKECGMSKSTFYARLREMK